MASEAGGADRRKFPRIDLQTPLHCRLLTKAESAKAAQQIGLDEPEIPSVTTGTPSPAMCLAINLSTGGLGAEGDLTLLSADPLAKGNDLCVDFELPDGRGLVRATARVAWAYPGSDGRSMCGLFFVLMKHRDLDRIHDYVIQAVEKAA